MNKIDNDFEKYWESINFKSNSPSISEMSKDLVRNAFMHQQNIIDILEDPSRVFISDRTVIPFINIMAVDSNYRENGSPINILLQDTDPDASIVLIDGEADRFLVEYKNYIKSLIGRR